MRSGAAAARRPMAAERSAAVGSAPAKPSARSAAASRSSVTGCSVKEAGACGPAAGWRSARVCPGAGMRTSTTCSATREDSRPPPVSPRASVKRLTSRVPVRSSPGRSADGSAGTAPEPSASSGAGVSSPPTVPPSSLTR